jgi:hypothetical protein
MNTTEDLIATECPAVASQPINKVIKPPAQPQEWKIVSSMECPTPENIQQRDPGPGKCSTLGSSPRGTMSPSFCQLVNN